MAPAVLAAARERAERAAAKVARTAEREQRRADKLRAKADRQAIDEGQEQLRIEVVIRENLPQEAGDTTRGT